MDEKVLFINISDIHTKGVIANSLIEEKLESLAEYISTLRKRHGCEKSLVMVSGDISHSGMSVEYEAIKPLFEELKKESGLLISPGNHDHDFSVYETTSRAGILGRLTNDGIEDDLVEMCIKGQKDYFDFESSTSSIKASEESSLSKKYEYGNYQVQALNTAWCSNINEQGELFFPKRCVLPMSENKVNILFFHHPLAWFEPDNQKELRNHIRDNFNIIVTGHEHASEAFSVTTNNATSLHIESIAFDDEKIQDNGFVSFIVEEKDVLVEQHLWKEGAFSRKEGTKKSEIISLNSKSVGGHELNIDYLNKLNDLGTAFRHKDKENLLLNDVFVYPNITVDSESNKLQKKSSADLLIEDKFKKTIITGDEICGKSTLLKKLYLDFLDKGKICLMLEGKSIKKSRKLKFQLIEEALKEQYLDMSYQDFCKTSEDKVLFVDDFDVIKGPAKELSGNSLDLFMEFDSVIVTVSDSYDLVDSRLEADNVFSSFEKVELLRLGFKLRFQLIDKWNSLSAS